MSTMSPERRRLAVMAGGLAAISGGYGAIGHPHGAASLLVIVPILIAETALVVAIVRLMRREGCTPIWQRIRR